MGEIGATHFRWQAACRKCLRSTDFQYALTHFLSGPTRCPGSGFCSSKEASWVGKAPLPVSWEVYQLQDPMLEEVEGAITLAWVEEVEVGVVAGHLMAACS